MFAKYAPFAVYTCLVGSRAYGLANEQSDTDTRGIFVPPANMHWSLGGVPEQIEDTETDTVYWELECLWSPFPLHMTEIGEKMFHIRSSLLSKRVIPAYRGYALAQWRRLERSYHDTQAIVDWKHAMHTLRLLIAGESTLRHCEVQVDMPEYRTPLLAVRSGAWDWHTVDAWRQELVARMDEAARTTRLPEEPDTATANKFLVATRRWAFYHLHEQ